MINIYRKVLCVMIVFACIKNYTEHIKLILYYTWFHKISIYNYYFLLKPKYNIPLNLSMWIVFVYDLYNKALSLSTVFNFLNIWVYKISCNSCDAAQKLALYFTNFIWLLLFLKLKTMSVWTAEKFCPKIIVYWIGLETNFYFIINLCITCKM